MDLSSLNVAPSARGEITLCCPFCVKRGKSEDTGYHLGINVKKGVYHCFRCEAAGKVTDIKEFALLVGTPTTSNDFSFLKSKAMNLFSLNRSDSSINLDEVSWPLNEHDTPIAFSYMTKRGFSPEEIMKYNLRVGHPYNDNTGKEVRKFSGRVLFPFISDGKCIYFIARSVNESTPKYLNADGSKSLVVYNIDNVKDDKCIICEGIISAISAERTCGVSAVAILGKSISNHQINKIRSKCSKVYLSLDGDVKPEEKHNIIKRLVRIFDEVYDVMLPEDKDPDELGKEYPTYFEKAKRITLVDAISYRENNS